MVRSYLALAGVTVAALGLSGAVTNCGGSTVTGGTGGGTTTTTTAGAHAEPPAAGPMKPGDGTGSVTFAVSKLYLGDTDPDGTPDKANGWKNYGYDLDGKISTATSTDLCKPADGASPKNVYPDGNNGTDNSFGKLILPIILGISTDASSKINESITGGKFTIMLDLEKLGAGADYNPPVTNLFAGGNLGSAPKFDGTDKWPVRPELLNDPTDITKGSKVSFATSYVTSNTWVSGSKGNVELDLSISGFTLGLTISNAVITLNLAADHKTGTQGIIAGVLNTEALTTQLKAVAGSFDPSLCTGPTIMSIVDQITQASDIMADGSQDPTQTCDGISIGIGFDAELVQLGPIAARGDARSPSQPVRHGRRWRRWGRRRRHRRRPIDEDPRSRRTTEETPKPRSQAMGRPPNPAQPGAFGETLETPAQGDRRWGRPPKRAAALGETPTLAQG